MTLIQIMNAITSRSLMSMTITIID